MSEHGMMGHEEETPSNGGPGTSNGLSRIARSRYFALGVTVAAMLAGFLLARRFGIGGRLLPVIGLAAFMMVGHSFMHGGHGSHGGRGSHGGHGSGDPQDTRRGQGGCH